MKKKYKILLTIFLCIVTIIFLFSWFGKKLTPKLIAIANLNFKHYMEKVGSDFKIYSLKKDTSNALFIPTKNEKGEIISIDYDLDKIYEISNSFTNYLKEEMEISSSIPYEDSVYSSHSENKILLNIPMGMTTDNLLLSNLGPKIPIYIYFMDSVFTKVQTKVTDYGINNALLEVYLNVKITYNIVSPTVKEEETLEYDILLNSKVIQGIVPYLYGKIFDTTTFSNVFP